MTRRSDLMCEDIFGCDHSASVPLSEDGELMAWSCRCGAVKHSVGEGESTLRSDTPTDEKGGST